MSKTILVTGGSGYIAGPVVARLLEGGHTVHTTVRDPSKATLLEPLKQLKGAKENLKVFKADLLQPGSFDEAVKGCDAVIHIASPFLGSVKPSEVESKLLKPAIEGTANVLNSVNKTETVTKVVLTSSMASVVADMKEHGENAVLNEDTWSIRCSPTSLPYYYSKREAEKKAWEMQRAQSRWTLATIHPGIVIGPPVIRRDDSESIKLLTNTLNGKFWPAVPPFVFPASTLEDVVSAHCLAATTPNAQGRYLVAECIFAKDLLYTYLKDDFKQHRLPFMNGSLWMVRLFGPLLGVPRDQVEASYCRSLPKVDCSKAERDLGLKLGSIKQATIDMGHKLIEFGIVKKR